jgi:hypothetical protein
MQILTPHTGLLHEIRGFHSVEDIGIDFMGFSAVWICR